MWKKHNCLEIILRAKLLIQEINVFLQSEEHQDSKSTLRRNCLNLIGSMKLLLNQRSTCLTIEPFNMKLTEHETLTYNKSVQ